MKKHATRLWITLATLNLLIAGLWIGRTSVDAAPQAGRPPFSNAVEQRGEMVRQLKEIRALLKEQNALLRSALLKNKKQ